MSNERLEIRAMEAGKKIKEMREGNLNNIAGCMIGGAVGDALGYAVEFDSYGRIIQQYGSRGITQYELSREGVAYISDDTQMSLFTANGILNGYTGMALRGIMGPIEEYVNDAYKDWLVTQMGVKPPEKPCTWLAHVSELYARRAPGNTCLNALCASRQGTLEKPVNDSKGCGGIMRVAPLALSYGLCGKQLDILAEQGAKIAALTHGHSLGYMPAAVLVYILNRGVFEKQPELVEIVKDSKAMLERLFVGDMYLEYLLELMDRAVALAGNELSDIENIRQLGEGWVAEETLAIALYCSLRYREDFSAGVIASVNHDGDSDSTGAVTGNILGALNGLNAIEGRWKRDLELYDVIYEMAEDLCRGCLMSEYSSYRDEAWIRKYVKCQWIE